MAYLLASRPRSPAAAFESMLMAANRGRYAEATEGLSHPVRDAVYKFGLTKELWDTVTRNGTISRIEILKKDVRGDAATVDYIIHYAGGGSITSRDEFVKEGGKWKVTMTIEAMWVNRHR